MTPSKEEIAASLVLEVREWVIGKPEPPKNTYRCLVCDYTTLGKDNCVDHVILEHKTELILEVKV